MKYKILSCKRTFYTVRFTPMQNGSFKVKYIASTVVSTVLSVILFALFFVGGQNGIIHQYFSEISPVVSLQAEENTKQGDIQNMTPEQLIQTYENYLNSEYLIVVNKDHALPQNYTPELTQVGSTGIFLQKEAAEQLQAFLADAKEAGFDCQIRSGYRDEQAQQNLYNEEYKRNQAAGYSGDDIITAKTKLNVAPAGYSEHQTGLAVDIGQTEGSGGSIAEYEAFYRYAKENIYKYGFIVRYPANKKDSTGYDEKPWHFRYIGDVEQAQYITEKEISLEEYIEYLKAQIEINQQQIEDNSHKVVVSQFQ